MQSGVDEIAQASKRQQEDSKSDSYDLEKRFTKHCQRTTYKVTADPGHNGQMVITEHFLIMLTLIT